MHWRQIYNEHSDITDCTLDSKSSGLLRNHQKTDIGILQYSTKFHTPVLASYLQFTPDAVQINGHLTRAYKLITGQKKIYIALTQKVSCVNSHATSNQTC